MALTRVTLYPFSCPTCHDNIVAFKRAFPLPRSICYRRQNAKSVPLSMFLPVMSHCGLQKGHSLSWFVCLLAIIHTGPERPSFLWV